MSELRIDPEEWAVQQFGACELGDARRTRRLVRVAAQVAARPDGSTPDQTEHWGDCKAAGCRGQQRSGWPRPCGTHGEPS